MVKFNEEKFEKIISDDSFSLYDFKKNKVYLFNETSQYIIESMVMGKSLDDIIEDFCADSDYDIKTVRNDFEKTVQFFYREEIIHNV